MHIKMLLAIIAINAPPTLAKLIHQVVKPFHIKKLNKTNNIHLNADIFPEK